MIERRFFIPETAKDIFEIESSSRFYLIGDFDNGKIYHDTISENHDLYYVEHEQMNSEEMEKYLDFINCEENASYNGDSIKSIYSDKEVIPHRFSHKNIKKETGALCKGLEITKKYDNTVQRIMKSELN